MLRLGVLVAVCVAAAAAVSFSVDATTMECLYEDLQQGQTTTLMFQVTLGGFLDIDVEVKAPTGALIYAQQRQTEGKYTFLPQESGQYAFCFGNKMSTLTPKVVSFAITKDTTHAKAPATIDMTPVEQAVNGLVENVRAMVDDQVYMKMREKTHRNTNESTNARVIWWSLFEVLVLIAMSLWQIFYLRRFFEVKRVV